MGKGKCFITSSLDQSKVFAKQFACWLFLPQYPRGRGGARKNPIKAKLI